MPDIGDGKTLSSTISLHLHEKLFSREHKTDVYAFARLPDTNVAIGRDAARGVAARRVVSGTVIDHQRFGKIALLVD